MLAMTANRLSAIRRASRALRFFFIFLGAILVLGTLNNLTHPFPSGVRTVAGVAFQGAAITTKVQALWLIQVVAGAALNLKVLYHLIRLMGLFAKGQLFTAQNVSQIRQIALTMMCAPALWLVVLLAAWPQISAMEDQWVKIMPSFPGGALIGGGVFLLASRIMNEGRELRDEQDLVV